MADMNAILSEEYVGGDDGDVNPGSSRFELRRHNRDASAYYYAPITANG